MRSARGCWRKPSTNPSHRAAKTLSKDSSMSVAILAITGGTEIKDHNAHGSALLQTLRGQVSIFLTDTVVELPPGQLVTLAGKVPHYLSATVDNVVLLVVAADR
jgi:quercetin dioxygenase-like cupin family protein